MTLSFAGHETFIIREGWLHKGLALLNEDPKVLAGPDAADHLGVGQNMAKSIRHWLAVCGLALRGEKKADPLSLSPFGQLVWEKDPYFLLPGTWWAVHSELVRNPKAGAWFWFFNHFAQQRFERAVSIEKLAQFLKLHQTRMPSRTTLERDISCLLRCYAAEIPSKPEDPEDGNDCALRELGLLQHYPSSGFYQRTSVQDGIPPELIGYVIASTHPEASLGSEKIDLRLDLLATTPGGIASVTQNFTESLYALLRNSEDGAARLQLVGQAAERALRIQSRTPLEWLQAYYARIDQDERYAA